MEGHEIKDVTESFCDRIRFFWEIIFQHLPLRMAGMPGTPCMLPGRLFNDSVKE
jgi:hypothetical protein